MLRNRRFLKPNRKKELHSNRFTEPIHLYRSMQNRFEFIAYEKTFLDLTVIDFIRCELYENDRIYKWESNFFELRELFEFTYV